MSSGPDYFDVHRQRRSLYGQVADAYQAGRPDYPYRVWELLAQRCGLVPGSQVLEIGPGTGQATSVLLDRGAAVTAVEIDPTLAERLRLRFAGRELTVVVGPFETADLPQSQFDLVAAATSFHWVVPVGDGLEQCGRALRPGGWLALWWTAFSDRARPDPYGDELSAALEAIEPSLTITGPGGHAFAGAEQHALSVDERVGEIDTSGLFGPVEHELVRWTARHDGPQLRALFSSFSHWLALPEARRAVALDLVEQVAIERFGGVVERPYVTAVYLAPRLTG